MTALAVKIARLWAVIDRLYSVPFVAIIPDRQGC